MSHAWSEQMVHLARDLKVHGYEDGTLWFREHDGVEVVVEPMLDGVSLALHARLGRVDLQENLADLLRANAPSCRGCITAIDPVDDDVVLFRCLDDAALSYDTFVSEVQRFSQIASRGVPSLGGHDTDVDGPLSNHVEAQSLLRNAFGDFAHARGLEAPTDTDHFLVCMPEGGGISVKIDPASGQALLVSRLGLVPQGDRALRELLELHMLGESTGGAFFAIDGGDLILYRSVGVDTLDGLALDQLLSKLGGATVDCAQRLGIGLPRFD